MVAIATVLVPAGSARACGKFLLLFSNLFCNFQTACAPASHYSRPHSASLGTQAFHASRSRSTISLVVGLVNYVPASPRAPYAHPRTMVARGAQLPFQHPRYELVCPFTTPIRTSTCTHGHRFRCLAVVQAARCTLQGIHQEHNGQSSSLSEGLARDPMAPRYTAPTSICVAPVHIVLHSALSSFRQSCSTSSP